ncbi:protein starmaker-like [Penaeus monodon]|uniref:protein starmaker-like n=1 Tax=Penaeus monodon TaxID=6687 RepID=UPI0018A6E712|nr:protein starmaker-like [Penaeus monodon]
METDEHNVQNLRKRKNISDDDDINGDDARGGADDGNNSDNKYKRHDNSRDDVLTDSTIRPFSNIAEGYDDGTDTEIPIPEIKRERKKKNTQRNDKPKTQRLLLSNSEPTKRISTSQQHGVDSTSSRRFKGTTASQTTSKKESKKKGKKDTNKLTTDDATTRHIGGTATAQRSKNKKSLPSQKERKKDRISDTDTRSTESQLETESTSATSAKPKERDRDSDDKKDDTESQTVAEITSASSASLNERDHDNDEKKDDQSKKQQILLSDNESRNDVVLHSETVPSPNYDNSGDNLHNEADTTPQTLTLSKRQNISDAPSSEENIKHQTSTKRLKICDANITLLSPKRKGDKQKQIIGKILKEYKITSLKTMPRKNYRQASEKYKMKKLSASV